MGVRQKSFPWNMDSNLFREVVDTHQQMMQTMQQLMDVVRSRGMRDSLRFRQDRRPRSSSLSIHRGPTPQEKEEEVISIFEEYSILPQDVKENLPFMDYMDMHPKIGYKTEQAKEEYHTIASKWLIHGRNRESSQMDDITLHESALVSSNSNEVCKNLYDEFDSADLNLVISSTHEDKLELQPREEEEEPREKVHERKFVYETNEDVMETLKRCDEWNTRARAARLIAAQARQHIQEFKTKMGTNDARESTPTKEGLMEQLAHEEKHHMDTCLELQVVAIPKPAAQDKLIDEEFQLFMNQDEII
ncbi:hypothetical protein KI387_007006, partial [Taxus chinensis]